jgi:hypothetical protein
MRAYPSTVRLTPILNPKAIMGVAKYFSQEQKSLLGCLPC